MGASKQTQHTTTAPWGPTQGPLTEAIGRVENQYQSDINDPNRLVPQARGYVSDVLGGRYLDPASNPHLAALTSSITDPIQASLSAQFGRAGRGNSGDAARYISQGMTAGLAQPLFAQYNQERGLQQGAAGMSGPLDAAASLPLEQYLERLRGIGSMGSEGTAVSKTSMSPAQIIIGSLMALGSAYKSFTGR